MREHLVIAGMAVTGYFGAKDFMIQINRDPDPTMSLIVYTTERGIGEVDLMDCHREARNGQVVEYTFFRSDDVGSFSVNLFASEEDFERGGPNKASVIYNDRIGRTLGEFGDTFVFDNGQVFGYSGDLTSYNGGRISDRNLYEAEDFVKSLVRDVHSCVKVGSQRE